MEMKKCKKCEKQEPCEIVKTYVYKTATIHSYKNREGRIWNGHYCPDCNLDRIRKKFGYTRREDSQAPIIKKAVEKEKYVAQWIKDNLRINAEIGRGTGPDVLAFAHNKTWKIEVKPANLNGARWRTNKVTDKRKSDDLVAIVLPNQSVYFDTMKHHLSKCVKDGSRSVGSIVRLHGVDKKGRFTAISSCGPSFFESLVNDRSF